MKSPCYLVTLSLESSDFQTFLKQYVILVPFGALIYVVCACISSFLCACMMHPYGFFGAITSTVMNGFQNN